MTTAGRVGRVVAFPATAVAVALAAWGFSGTPNAWATSHSGFLFICRLNVNCNIQVATLGHNANYSAKALGLTPNITYNITYIAGDHTGDSDVMCHTSGTTVSGGGAILTNGSGAFGLVTVTMPNATGLHTFCVNPGGVPSTQALEAKHIVITLV